MMVEYTLLVEVLFGKNVTYKYAEIITKILDMNNKKNDTFDESQAPIKRGRYTLGLDQSKNRAGFLTMRLDRV
ncbi:hypothetical protein Hanom_Chr01g00028601 [Helianthus anomalus]